MPIVGRKAREASPNRAGGSGGCSEPPPPVGVLGGKAPYKKLSGLQRPLDSLKINLNFINCGYGARQKS